MTCYHFKKTFISVIGNMAAIEVQALRFWNLAHKSKYVAKKISSTYYPKEHIKLTNIDEDDFDNVLSVIVFKYGL